MTRVSKTLSSAASGPASRTDRRDCGDFPLGGKTADRLRARGDGARPPRGGAHLEREHLLVLLRAVLAALRPLGRPRLLHPRPRRHVRERRARLDARRRRARRERERELLRELLEGRTLALPPGRQLGDDCALLREPPPAHDSRLRRERRLELLPPEGPRRLPRPARHPRDPRR